MIRVDFVNKTMRRSFCWSRRAMTLVELLVVVGIIGIVAAIALPAVMGSRETARRLTCSSNLSQIGKAVTAYAAMHRKLPYGCLDWRPNSTSRNKQFAWSAAILPQLDESALYQKINYSLPYDHAANMEAASHKLPIYLCPSVVRKPQQRGPADYGGLYGQRLTTKSQTDNGVFVYNQAFSLTDIVDGLANTMAVAEDSAGPDSEWINGRNVFEQSGLINDRTVWIGDNEIRSNHRGGAMTVFLDGTARFLSESTDRSTLAAFITRAMRDVPQYSP